MISVIVSVANNEKYEKYLLPSIHSANRKLMCSGLPLIDLVRVSGTKSIYENYNRGMSLAKYSIKAYIHEDVNMLGGSWVFKLLDIFDKNPMVGLVGLVGTKILGNRFWWESGEKYIYGEIFSGSEMALWDFNPVVCVECVECVDGFFMATNKSIPWDENLSGFHCYDMDYSREVRKQGYNIVVMNHFVHHLGEYRNVDDANALMEAYQRKWCLV